MPDDLSPYRIVRAVGQAEFEFKCCLLMERGYVPAGSPTVMTVVHPITNSSDVGFLQAMYLPARERIVKPC
ncbi:MAG: hypothetical protein M0Z38_02590 [Deltaproteobacteria bacterium]|nr:hypothetical protein [Deltaproteobacteria bacterium]